MTYLAGVLHTLKQGQSTQQGATVSEEEQVASLTQQLSLKELQINRLLNITQAINDNRPAPELFQMYADFLSWDIGVRRMALYYKQDQHWECASQIGLQEEERLMDLSAEFDRFQERGLLEHETHPLLSSFEVVIPVVHKDLPLVYVFMGGFSDANKSEQAYWTPVQFVTTITHVVAVAIENKRLFKRQLQQERYQAELAIATDIQRSLVPEALPRSSAYEMAALYLPRFGVGGDFYSAEKLDDGRLLFCVADISGKGTGAALLMSHFEATFWSLSRQLSTLAALVQSLNAALFRVTRGDRFLTLFLGEFDANSRQLTYVNAGHNPPLLAHEKGQVEMLRTGCTVLGAFERIPHIKTGRQDLSRGGLLICYTDGVSELSDAKGEMYGEERLAGFAVRRAGMALDGIGDALLEDLQRFQGVGEPSDDLTMLALRFAA